MSELIIIASISLSLWIPTSRDGQVDSNINMQYITLL